MGSGRRPPALEDHASALRADRLEGIACLNKSRGRRDPLRRWTAAVDVYITGLGGNRLFRNLGGGRFADVTARAGVGGGGFGTSAAFFDFDKDGRLDLFVCNYVDWSVEKDLFCTLDGTRKSYCTPESYKGHSPALYRNRGDGTFEDVTAKAGLRDSASKALGVAVL